MYLSRELTDADAAGDRPRVRRPQPHHRPARLPAHAERIANDREAYEAVRRLTETLGGRGDGPPRLTDSAVRATAPCTAAIPRPRADSAVCAHISQPR